MIGASIRTVLGVSLSALVILFGAAFAVTAIVQGAMYGAETPAAGAEWADYPATAWSDADAVLDDPSEEETLAASAELTEDIRTAISAEFDVDWSADESNAPSATRNGYGNDSLLHTWSGERWRGEIPGRDAGARERIQEIVEEVGAQHGADEFQLSNDRDETGAQLAEDFGSADRDAQAYWQSLLDGGPHRTHSIFTQVYDSAYPTGSDYLGWTPRDSFGEPVDASTPTISISLGSSAYDLLPAGDRAEYEERLAAYAGLDKPAGQY